MKQYLLVLHRYRGDDTSMSILLALTASLLGLGIILALVVLGLRAGDRAEDPRVRASLRWSLEADGWTAYAHVAVRNSSLSPVVFSIDVRPTPRWLGSICAPLSVSVPWPGHGRHAPSSADTLFVVEPGAQATSDLAFAPSQYARVTTTLHQSGGRIRVWKASLRLLGAPGELNLPTLQAAA
jgi:hypothetical protein